MEVMVATMILGIGLLSIAAFMGGTVKTTRQSKYMSLATTLAVEKMEDLMRWDTGDHHVYVAAASTAGSLTSNTGASVTTRGSTVYVNYFDEIQMGSTGGSFAETVSAVSGSTTSYTTTSHFPTGIVSVASTSVAPVTFSFLRRWTIEMDQPVTGVKRITVVVTAQDPAIKPPVSFQMTAVRP